LGLSTSTTATGSDTRVTGITPGGLNHPASTSSASASASGTGSGSGSAEISGYLSSVLSVEHSGGGAGGVTPSAVASSASVSASASSSSSSGAGVKDVNVVRSMGGLVVFVGIGVLVL